MLSRLFQGSQGFTPRSTKMYTLRVVRPASRRLSLMKTSLFSTSPPTTPQGAHISLKTFLAAGAFSFAAVSFYKIQFEEKVTSMSKTVKTTGKALVGGDWTMVDITTGELVTNETVLEDGHFSLLYFGFAKCPDICPSELVKVGKVLDTMKKKHKHIKITPGERGREETNQQPKILASSSLCSRSLCSRSLCSRSLSSPLTRSHFNHSHPKIHTPQFSLPSIRLETPSNN